MTDSLSRRDMIAATAAALAVPLLPVKAPTAPAAVGLSGKFLTPAEYALLDELTELIIPSDAHSPGARAAGVAGYIDSRLAESLEPERQALWRAGLEAGDGLSRELSGPPVLTATPGPRVTGLPRLAAGGPNPQTPPGRLFRGVQRWTA